MDCQGRVERQNAEYDPTGIPVTEKGSVGSREGLQTIQRVWGSKQGGTARLNFFSPVLVYDYTGAGLFVF